MPASPETRGARVRGALALRRWALPALCGAAGAPPAVSPGAWDTFLRGERCAVPLLALGDAALGDGATHVRRRATIETQRVLSAAAQLHQIGARAGREGWAVVALKGGVPLAEGRAGVDLMDVDVLAAEPQARALGRALDAEGYDAYGRASAHRLRERTRPDAVQVEIHTGIPGIGAAEGVVARSLPSRAAGVRVPHPADHLWHLLLHTTAQHTGRRGSLRELVLLSDALSRCGADDLAEVDARAAGRPDAGAIRAQLELARRLRERRPPETDPFATVAAALYLMVEHLPGLRLPHAFKSALAEAWVIALAHRGGTPPPAEPAPGGALRSAARRLPWWVLGPPAHLLARAAERVAREP